MLDLKLNKKVLSKKIRCIKIHNIQGLNDIVYDFPESGLVRIKADNEVGKSILMKTMKIFIKGHLDNKEIRESFIKDGTSKAYVLILLNNRYTAGLVFDNNISTKGYYYIQAPDGIIEYLPISETPRKVIDLLGFYYNDELDFCLNIRETHPVIITDTSPRVTSESLSCAIDNPAIDTAIEKVQKTIKSTESTLNYINNTILGYQISLNNITIKDTNTLKAREDYISSSISLLKQIQSVKEGVTSIILNINNIYNYQKKLLISDRDIDSLIDKFSLLNISKSLLNSISINLTKLQSMEYVTYSKDIPTLINIFAIYKDIRSNINAIIIFINKIQLDITTMKKYNSMLVDLKRVIVYKDIKEDIQWLMNSSKLLEGTEFKNTNSIENYINLFKINSNIKDNLVTIKTLSFNIENNIKIYRRKSNSIIPTHIAQLEKNKQILQQILVIKSYINKIKNQSMEYHTITNNLTSVDSILEKFGVCRLCGQPLHNHNHSINK